MDKRLFLPVIVMLASVLLVSGMVNFQAGSAQEAPGSGNPDPSLEDPEVVAQKADPTAAKKTEMTYENTTVAPSSTPTMMYGGGGFAPTAVTEEPPKQERPVVTVVRAAFTADAQCLTVSFTDMSENATSWKWDFGDDTGSTEQNPVHTYAMNGSYLVTLTVYGDDDSGYSTEKELIIEDCEPSGPEEEDPSKEYPSAEQEIPEFPTIAIPMIAIIGMAFFFRRKE
ncbi:PKD domain-containing protein [Methanolobus sp. WCC5]|uniref:PKD domain-containing protein n=1 Tax=Methanolobus sp. WCC5 TaxID=3125785 RepID=UPI00325124E8